MNPSYTVCFAVAAKAVLDVNITGKMKDEKVEDIEISNNTLDEAWPIIVTHPKVKVS